VHLLLHLALRYRPQGMDEGRPQVRLPNVCIAQAWMRMMLMMMLMMMMMMMMMMQECYNCARCST